MQTLQNMDWKCTCRSIVMVHANIKTLSFDISIRGILFQKKVFVGRLHSCPEAKGVPNVQSEV